MFEILFFNKNINEIEYLSEMTHSQHAPDVSHFILKERKNRMVV